MEWTPRTLVLLLPYLGSRYDEVVSVLTKSDPLALAGHPRTSAAVLDQLSTNPSLGVRLAVGMNPKARTETRDRLKRDKSAHVRKAASGEPDLRAVERLCGPAGVLPNVGQFIYGNPTIDSITQTARLYGRPLVDQSAMSTVRSMFALQHYMCNMRFTFRGEDIIRHFWATHRATVSPNLRRWLKDPSDKPSSETRQIQAIVSIPPTTDPPIAPRQDWGSTPWPNLLKPPPFRDNDENDVIQNLSYEAALAYAASTLEREVHGRKPDLHTVQSLDLEFDGTIDEMMAVAAM